MEEVGGFWTRFQGKQRGKQSSLSLYKGGTVENWVFLSSQQPLSKLSCNNPHPPPTPHHFHRWSTTGSLTGYLVYLKILRSHSTEWQKSLAFKVKSIRIFFLQKKTDKRKQKRKQSKTEKIKKEAYKKRTNKKIRWEKENKKGKLRNFRGFEEWIIPKTRRVFCLQFIPEKISLVNFLRIDKFKKTFHLSSCLTLFNLAFFLLVS